MKKFVALCLLMGMVINIASCQSTPSSNPGNDTNDSTDTTAPEIEKPFLDNLGEYNFGGADFTMLVREERADDIFVEEANGDLLNDAVYERNRKIAERFNVKINSFTLPDDSNMWNSTIQNDVMSNSGEYDVVMPDYWWGCETHGYFLNLLDYDVLEFDQPWWCKGWNDNAEVFGQLYNAAGYLSLDLIRNLEVVYFNKNLLDTLNLEDPYELVSNRKWTLDKLNEMANAALADLNGDQTYSINDDRIGYTVGCHSGRAVLASSGVQTSAKIVDGKYNVEYLNERYIDIYNRVYTLINENDSVYYNRNDWGANDQKTEVYSAFMNDRVLFMGEAITMTDTLRGMTGDYGIIPVPMFDEKQEDYITYNLGIYYMAVPVTAKNPEMSAVMLEALNAESYKSVKNTYYDTALKGKYSRDDNTAEMLDLISDSVYFDFAFTNGSFLEDMVISLYSWIYDKNPNVASKYESSRSAIEQKIEKFNENYLENIETE
ncbi:MAG: extracellular solute-binding protein [Clostridiales bacterium]|nr:extracellular solute-binding protein [Clostridiales bacterium]